jgi:hypothetical protein
MVIAISQLRGNKENKLPPFDANGGATAIITGNLVMSQFVY